MNGLPIGLAWQGGPTPGLENHEPPQDNLVGHWDFTDYTQLIGSLSGSWSGSYLAGTDPIGRCKNKAPSGTTNSKLGQWVRAETDDKRPLWFTGGANGNAYAKFDNSSHTQSLVCRSTDYTNWGAMGVDLLSATKLRAENISIFIVGEPLDDDTDGTPENAFSYWGYYDRYNGTPADEIVRFNLERDDDDDIHAVWNIEAGVVTPNTVDSVNVTRHWNSGGPSIINIQTHQTVGGSHIYTNNSADTGQSIYSVGSGPVAQNPWADLDPVDYDDSLTCSIGIGGRVNASGQILSDSFEGKIYEVLVYSSRLSEEDRLALTYYLANKYAIELIEG